VAAKSIYRVHIVWETKMAVVARAFMDDLVERNRAQLIDAMIHTGEGYTLRLEHYKARVNLLMCLCMGVTYFMVAPLLLSTHMVAAWNQTDVVSVTEKQEMAWHIVRAMQLTLAYLHAAFVFIIVPLTRHWRRFDDRMFRHLAIIDQILVLHFVAWFLACTDTGAGDTHWSRWLLFVFAHLRFADLVRYWCQDKTFFPLIVNYPYLSHSLHHGFRSRDERVHDE
jgi:hypothetical protein